MIKLSPIQFDKVWGYERWIASVHPNGCQQNFLSAAGKDYPLLVKVIQADESLSVQVHPDDLMACRLEGEGNRGKTECWYVLDAQPGARLVYGLKGSPDQSELLKAIEQNTLENYLNLVSVKAGDFIFIPSGTVHAIGGGLRLMEVQQSCDITYRMYDWGRARELHIRKAVESIKNDSLNEIKRLDAFECPYFRLKKTDVESESSFTVTDSMMNLFFIISGKGAVHDNHGNTFEFSAEDIFSVNNGETITIKGNSQIIHIQP